MIDDSSMIPQPWSDARSMLHGLWREAMEGAAWSSALRTALGEIDLHLVWQEMGPDRASTSPLFDHDPTLGILLATARVETLATGELLDCARVLRDLAHMPVGYWCGGTASRCLTFIVAGGPSAQNGADFADIARCASVKIDTARTRVAYLVVDPQRLPGDVLRKDPEP